MEIEADNRCLEAESIRDWLDKQITLWEEQKRSYKFNDSIRCYHPGHEIPLDNGSVYIADLLGMELMETARDDIEYPFRYEFKYNGVIFYQISKERLLMGDGSDGNEMLADKERAS